MFLDKEFHSIDLISRTADGFIAFLAYFTIAQQCAYFAGFDFIQSWGSGFVLAFLGIYFLKPSSPDAPPQSATSHFHYASLWLAIIGGVSLVLLLHRPDADDQFYLGQAVLALDHADSPMRDLDVMRNGYVLTSYDFLRAALTKFSGIPLLTSYYLVWPVIIAMFAIIFQWRLLSLLGVRHMALAMGVFFIIMIGWGDAHRTPANMGFVRFFQGKAGLIWVAIPAATIYWLKLLTCVEGKSRHLHLLFLSIVAGVGFSPTGAPLGALLTSLFLLATACKNLIRPNEKTPVYWLLFVLAYPVFVGLLMHYYFSHSSAGVHTAHGIVSFTTTYEMTQFVLGSGYRGVFALLCLACAPFILWKNGSTTQALAIYISICLALLAFPLTSHIVGRYGYTTMSWRWLYVIPFVPATILVMDHLAGSIRSKTGGLIMIVMTLVIYLSLSPQIVISKQNMGTRITLPNNKWAAHDAIYLRQYGQQAIIEDWMIISPKSHARY